MSYTLYYDRWMPDEPDAVRALARRKLAEYVDLLPPRTDAVVVDMATCVATSMASRVCM